MIFRTEGFFRRNVEGFNLYRRFYYASFVYRQLLPVNTYFRSYVEIRDNLQVVNIIGLMLIDDVSEYWSAYDRKT